MAFGKEIKRLRNAHNVSAQLLADAIGIDSERLRSWEKKDFNPREEDTILIEQYFKMPIEELVKLEKLPKVPTKEEVYKDGEPVAKPYRQQRLEQKLNGSAEGIPVFETAPQTLTNTPVYRDERVGQADFWITIPDLRDCDYGFRAKGDSMHPLIRNRALVIGREIQDKSIIIFGDIYIVHTVNGLETVKYVQQDESDPDRVVLVPFNEKAKTTSIHKNEILRLFEARAVFNPL